MKAIKRKISLFPWVLKLALMVIIGAAAYFNRWIFTYKFEPEYWENYYYESQC